MKQACRDPHLFELVPFQPEPGAPVSSLLAIQVYVTRDAEKLTLRYHCSTHLKKQIRSSVLPFPLITQQQPLLFQDRVDRLWEQTCFECFLSSNPKGPYFELNLNPQLNWNVYAFTQYRTSQLWVPKETFSLFDFNTRRLCPGPDAPWELEVSLQLNPLQLTPHQPIYLGLSVITQLQNQTTLYWSLSHPHPKPDFHDSASWVRISA